MTLHITTQEVRDMTELLLRAPSDFLLSGPCRQYLARSRWLKSSELRTYDAATAAVTSGSIAHNARDTQDNIFTSHKRTQRLLGPLSALDPVYHSAEKQKVLSIGPRTEMEIFHLLAIGFELHNITAIDLVSSSPFITLGDMHALPYADHTYDVVISSWVLNYSNDPALAVSEMVRVAKPGALVAIGVTYDPDTARSELVGSMQKTGDDLVALVGSRLCKVMFCDEPGNAKGPVMLIGRLDP